MDSKKWIMLILKYLFYGIGWGSAMFVLICIVGFEVAGEAFLVPIMQNFTTQALSAELVGIACASTSIIYKVEQIPFALKAAVHFVVGMGCYFGVAFRQSWMPAIGTGGMISFVLIGLLFFVSIWLGFYFYNRMEAKKLNKKLREMDNC